MDWDTLFSLIVTLLQLAVVITGLIFIILYLIKITKKQTAKKAQELARIKWLQEKKSKAVHNSVDWICKSCGNANHNREVCEACGSIKRV